MAPSQAQADGWDMAICDYEQTWVPECSQPWTIPAPTIKYRVQKGDTLWNIASRAYGPTPKAGHRWKQIARANRIKACRIYVGQVLTIPRALRDPATGYTT